MDRPDREPDTTRRRWLTAGAVMLSLALVATACGDDDDDAAAPVTAATSAAATTTAATAAAATTTAASGTGTTAAGEEPTTTEATEPTPATFPSAAQFADLERLEPPATCPEIPGVSDDTIKVGMIVPQSGLRATSFATSEIGVRARIDKANEEGELGGRTIELVAVDDASDAARNSEVARTLVEGEDVYGIIEISDQSDGSADYLNENQIPVAGWHVGRPHWGQQNNFFALRLPGAAEPEVNHTTRTGEVLTELGATKVATVGGGNQSSASFVGRENKSIEAAGLEVVYTSTEIQPGQTEFTAIVDRIKDSGADGLLTGVDFLQNTALVKQLSDAGVELNAVLFPGGYDPRVLAIEGIEGASFGLEFYPFEATPTPPAFTEFDTWMPEDGTRNQVNYIGWLSAEMFIQGIKEAGVECPTREAFINNLRLIEDYTANGAFDPIDLISTFGAPFPCTYYVRVEEGKFVPLFEGKAKCGEPLVIE